VAIRSSATAEDLPEASFAGQQETYLNVRGEEALLAAVKRCWASLWTARAMAYRARHGIDPASVSLAVVVQQMVPAEVSGVLFTVNPLTGDRDEMLINAAWGLGEALVSGRVTPDSIVVDKAGGQVKRMEVGDKALMTVPADDGTQEVSVAVDRRQALSLTSEQITELARLGREIEAHFGAPQDVEWAIADGQVYILQARPVTGLREAPKVAPAPPGDDDWPALGEKPPQPFDLWTRANLGEAWPYPVSPLLWSSVPFTMNLGMRYSLQGFGIPYLDAIQWANRFYGRLYFNEGALAHIFSHELGLPGSFVDRAFGSQRGAYRPVDERAHPLRFLRRAPALLRAMRARIGTGERLEALFPRVDAWVEAFEGLDLAAMSDRELRTEAVAWFWRFIHVMNLHMAVSGWAMTAYSTLEQMLERWLQRKDLAHDLVTGLSGVYAAEMGVMLWEMAQRLRELGLAEVVLEHPPREALERLRATPAAEPVLRQLDAFLQRHGHRCPNEGEWLNPRWREAPWQVIELVAGYLRAGERANPIEVERQQRRRREEAAAWVEAHLDPLRRAAFRWILKRAQRAVRLRDNGRHYMMKAAYPTRHIFALFGQRWTERDWLAQPDDLFFLTILEIDRVLAAGGPREAGLDLKRLVAERRKAYEFWFSVEAPEVLDAQGRPVEVPAVEAALPAQEVLQGIPASGGRARGTARIIFDPREATRLQPGDILVTRATDPGWTPVFPLVSGLVLEVGGQLSHGAIVAREYGIPAVVNVRDATRRIRDGQSLIVDGSTGRVHLIT